MPEPQIDALLAEAPPPEGKRRPDRWFYSRSARAMKLRGRRARPLVNRVKAKCPWIEDSDLPTLRGWADLEIVGSGLMAELIENGIVEDGKPRPILDALRKLRDTQLGYAKTLGLCPVARAALKASNTTVALDLARTAAELEDETAAKEVADG
jgi:hypothetical protein